MIDFDGRDPQSFALEHERGPILGRRWRSVEIDGTRQHAPRRRRHDVLAVVRRPIALIHAMGLVESGDDAFDARATVDGETLAWHVVRSVESGAVC